MAYGMLEMKITLNRHGPRLMSYNHQHLDPLISRLQQIPVSLSVHLAVLQIPPPTDSQMILRHIFQTADTVKHVQYTRTCIASITRVGNISSQWLQLQTS